MNTKILSLAAVAGLLIGSTAIAQAQTRHGTGGASGVSPGHEMQQGEGRGGPGASRLAPGHNKGTTGAGDRDDRTNGFGGRDADDLPRDDTDGMDNDRRGIDKE
jgi:hypothetical protein